MSPHDTCSEKSPSPFPLETTPTEVTIDMNTTSNLGATSPSTRTPNHSSSSIATNIQHSNTYTPQPIYLSTAQSGSAGTVSIRTVTLARRNWLSYLFEYYRNASRTSKLMLLLSLISFIIQITSILAVLLVTQNEECDKPLRLYLIFYGARIFLSTPILVAYHLHPGRHNANDHSDILLNWIDRGKSLLDLIGTFVFLVGNYLLFTTTTCQKTSPGLFGLSMALVIFGYFVITIPVFLCGAVIFCLPCVLVIMRTLRIGETTGAGATEDIIAKIPILIYRKSPLSEVSLGEGTVSRPQATRLDDNNNSTHLLPQGEKELISPTQPQTVIQRMRKKLFYKEALKNSPHEPTCIENSVGAVAKIREEDAICCICLSQYEDGDKLRQLHCSHHFHVDCVDEWLKLNRTCPLCKRDITQSHSISDDTEVATTTSLNSEIRVSSTPNSTLENDQ
ncbi:hypothetical protein K7432_014688 [Basidiobolus ranarum]|uniref:RING-type domain-containing protein n=1 Tax=Basidiobolus ranarum TaxID=34480 RepID=A0ABR2VP62_9FUNG